MEKPTIEFSRSGGNDALSIGGTSFFAKEHYYVFRSVGTTFDFFGGILDTHLLIPTQAIQLSFSK